MNNESGTIEKIGLLLAESIAPLESRLQTSRVLDLFLQFGLVLPHSALTPTLLNAIDATGNHISDMQESIDELTAAINNEDFTEIIESGINLITTIKAIIDSFQLVAQEINLIGNAGGLSQSEFNEFLVKLPSNIAELLFIEYIEGKANTLFSVLELLGIITLEPQNINSNDIILPPYTKKKIHFDRIISLLTDPESLFNDVYSWGEVDFEADKFIRRLYSLFSSVGLPAVLSLSDDPGPHVILDVFLFRMSQTLDPGLKGLDVKLLFPFDEIDAEIDLSEELKLKLDIGLPVPVNTGLKITPPLDLAFFFLSGNPTGSVSVVIEKSNSDSSPISILNIAGSSGIFVDKISFGALAQLTWDVSTNSGIGRVGFLGEIIGGKIIIDSSEGDGFINTLLSNINVEADFDLKFGWISGSGFYFEGSSALEIQLPAHIDLGVVQINNVILSIGFDNDQILAQFSSDIIGQLGPFSASVSGIGTKALLAPNSEFTGNLGFADLDVGFKAPSGVGISVDASVVKGGGFLYIDVEKGEYAGVVELSIQNTISLKAIGIINTKLPNGEDGFALLLLITAEFTPIQLGFGFTLNGVGGLLGANRGMNLTAIREGVRNDTLDHILFPDDPVANAPAIISNLNSVFPIAEGNHSFGLMAIIGWGTPTLLEVELGLMISFPSFDLAVIGKVSTALPTKEAAILKLNVAFAGTMSFEKKYFYFDAAIFDSKLLTFSLSGQMALRILWGDEPNFVLSVGGFHPDFVPPPLELNALERITLNLLADDNPKLTLKCYFAVTSNTVQFGASIDFLFKVSKFKVVGYLYFHALFQFDPFYFKVSVGAGLDVKLGSSTILSVSVSGSLEGPTPWKIKGKGKFKILFISFSVSFSETWGETRDTNLPGVDVFPKLEEAILDDRNWSAQLPQNSTLTSLRDLTNGDEDPLEELTIHPFGSLSLLQRVVPLKETIDIFGNQEPSDFNRFELSMKLDGDDIDSSDKKDYFAPAQFFELSDSEKISKDAYVKYRAGLAADTTEDLTANHHVNKLVEYEIEILDSKDNPPKKGVYVLGASQMKHWSKGSAIAKSELGLLAEQRVVEKGRTISLAEETFVLVNQSDLSLVTDVGPGSELELQHMLDDIVLENPEMESELMVVSSFEIL